MVTNGLRQATFSINAKEQIREELRPGPNSISNTGALIQTQPGYHLLMARSSRNGPPPPSDADRGIWQGQSVARVALSPDGMTVLIGRTARDNDVLSLKLASPRDFWFHTAGESGSHVVVRNPDNLARLPRDTRRFAASLAAGYSKARRGGKVAVHEARARDVSKPRGLPPGKVVLSRYTSLTVEPLRLEESDHPD